MEKRGCWSTIFCLWGRESKNSDRRLIESLPRKSDWESIYTLIDWLDRNKSTFFHTDNTGIELASQHAVTTVNWLGSNMPADTYSLSVLKPNKYLLSGVADTFVRVSFSRIDRGPVDIVTSVNKKSRKGPNVSCNWSGYRLFPFGEVRNVEVEENPNYKIALSAEDMDNEMSKAIDEAYQYTLSYLLGEPLQETPSNIISFSDMNKS